MGRMLVAALVLFLHIIDGVSSVDSIHVQDMVVRVDSGWVRGVRRRALLGDYYSFRGVPYAKQPLGRLRFQELQPPEPWTGVLDAHAEGPACPQHDVLYGPMMQPQGFSEACIHANVHVPAREMPLNGTEPLPGLPILVFVHGGGFGYGSGDTDLYGPEDLVSEGIIVITFNYRLGALGFLSLNSSVVPGNAGLRDVVTLLRWVRRNARAFGGDHTRVTLAGHSAGAAAANIVALSPLAQGLFSRLILMSGYAARSFYSSSSKNAMRVARRFLELVGVPDTGAHDQFEKLVTIPVDRIIEATRVLQDQEGLVVFAPVVEFPEEPQTFAPILTTDPEVLARNANALRVPTLIGFTSSEGNTFRRRYEEVNVVNLTVENSIAMVPVSLLFRLKLQQAQRVGDQVTAKYYGHSPSLDRFVSFTSEAYFEYPALKTTQWATERNNQVYLYRFSYESEARLLQWAIGREWQGAGHLQDLLSVFRSRSFSESEPPPGSRDALMRDRMVTLFGDFITGGEVSRRRGSRPATWPPTRPNHLFYMDINWPQFRLREVGERYYEMVDFFDSLYDSAPISS